MMKKTCRLCRQVFDPQQRLDLPEQQAGLLLATEEYGDAGHLCAACLASRGRLAMMYRSDYYS
jgi:hypothetical protein